MLQVTVYPDDKFIVRLNPLGSLKTRLSILMWNGLQRKLTTEDINRIITVGSNCFKYDMDSGDILFRKKVIANVIIK